jgi:hypothetical protein
MNIMKKILLSVLIIALILVPLVFYALAGSVGAFFTKVSRTDDAADGAYIDTEWIIGKSAEEIEERFGNSEFIYAGVHEYYVYYYITYENGVATGVSKRP